MLCNQCNRIILSNKVESYDYGNLREKESSTLETAAQIEEEILEIQWVIQSLDRRRAKLRSRINALSPISVLPMEVLSYIFRLATWKEVAFVGRATTPSLLGGVCNEWRSIIWSTPLLWNDLNLRISSKPGSWRPDLLHQWLLRATTSPLYITIDAEQETESTLSVIKDVIATLITRSDYWYSVDFLLPPSCHDMLKNVSLPMINQVVLRPPMCTISTFNDPPQMFTAAPQLREVNFFRYDTSSTFLPWIQLREFKTQSMTINNCLQLLQLSSNLETYELDNVYFSDISSLSSNISHNILQKLSIGIGKRGALSLFEHVALPALRDLNVSYYGDDHDNHSFIPILVSLIKRSKCVLHSLEMGTRLTGDDLIPLLEATPSLRDLYLRVWLSRNSFTLADVFTPNLLQRLTPDSSTTGTLLPNLRSMVYRGPIPEDWYPLRDFLRTRWNCVNSSLDGLGPCIARLDRVKFLLDQCVPDFRGELSKLSDDGMRVEFLGANEA